MKVVGVIPARYASTRFPGKPLVKILGKPMILWVAEKTAAALGKGFTYVATEDERIAQVVQEDGFQVVMTSPNCLTGTDRLWDFAQQVSAEIYVNVQGDEPMIKPNDILKVVEHKKQNPNCVVNAMCKLRPVEDPFDLTIPKVLASRNGDLIYMSRSPIPYSKSGNLNGIDFYKQVCIYAFNYEELKAFGSEPQKAYCEQFEDIEILRFLDLGFKIKMVEVEFASAAVDLPEHVPMIEKLLQNEHS